MSLGAASLEGLSFFSIEKISSSPKGTGEVLKDQEISFKRLPYPPPGAFFPSLD
jgi:hypothetical protein